VSGWLNGGLYGEVKLIQGFRLELQVIQFEFALQEPSQSCSCSIPLCVIVKAYEEKKRHLKHGYIDFARIDHRIPGKSPFEHNKPPKIIPFYSPAKVLR